MENVKKWFYIFIKFKDKTFKSINCFLSKNKFRPFYIIKAIRTLKTVFLKYFLVIVHLFAKMF